MKKLFLIIALPLIIINGCKKNDDTKTPQQVKIQMVVSGVFSSEGLPVSYSINVTNHNSGASLFKIDNATKNNTYEITANQGDQIDATMSCIRLCMVDFSYNGKGVAQMGSQDQSGTVQYSKTSFTIQ